MNRALLILIAMAGCAVQPGPERAEVDQVALHDVAASLTLQDGTLSSPLVEMGRPVADVDGAADALSKFGAGTETCSRNGDTCCTTIDPGWSCCCHVNSGIGTGCDCAPTPPPAPSNPPQAPFAPEPGPDSRSMPSAQLQQAVSIAASGNAPSTANERKMVEGLLAELTGTGTGAQTNECVNDPEWGAACCHNDGFTTCCCFVTSQGGHLCSCGPNPTTDPGHGGTSTP